MRRKIISVLMALCIVMMYTMVAYADSDKVKIHFDGEGFGDKIVLNDVEFEKHGGFYQAVTDKEHFEGEYVIDGKAVEVVNHGNGNDKDQKHATDNYWIKEKEVVNEDTGNTDSDLDSDTPDSEEGNEEQLEVKDAHFFVRIDRVVQHEDGNTHYEAKNYFPVGAVAEGYKYGSNSSDYASVDGKVKQMAHMNVEGNITDEMKAEAQDKIYSQMTEYPSKEDVVAAAEAYCKACGVEMNLENVDVLWYVIKDEGKTHVDGVLYNVETGEVVEAKDKEEETPERTPDPSGTKDITEDKPVIVPEGTEVEPLEADTFTIKVVYIDERGEVIGSDEWVFNEGKGDYAIPVDWNEWFLRGEDSVPDASEAYVEGEYLGFAWWESQMKNREMVVYLCKSADESDAAPFGDAEALGGDSDNDWIDTPASDGVQTGDEITMTFYWLMLIAVIALVIIGCLVIRRMDK